MFRFTIRDLLWLMVVVGLAVALIGSELSHRESEVRRLKEVAAHAIDVSHQYETALREDGYTVIGGHIVRRDNRGSSDGP